MSRKDQNRGDKRSVPEISLFPFGAYVLPRILWLEGLEEHNANTKERYIYIHGTNQEVLIGQPASIGCLRMKNADVAVLDDLVPEGAEVEIVA